MSQKLICKNKMEMSEDSAHSVNQWTSGGLDMENREEPQIDHHADQLQS